MSEDAALIEQPEGSPGAVSDAGSSLQRVAGGFERGGGVVARASSNVSAWQGPASVSFDGRVASYGLVMVAVEQVLQAARGAVRRYETALEDARAKIRELREQEEMTVARLNRAKTQLADAQTRLGQARERLSGVSAGAGMLDPASLSEQVQAGRDADNAQTDIDTAQKQIDSEREEIRELREDAKRVQKQLIDQEDKAASAVRAAAAQLPDVQLPGGAASPSAYAGTPFGGPLSPFANDPRWAEGMRKAAEGEDEDNDGNALDGLAKAWGDVKDEVGGVAEGGYNHLNVFDGDKFKDTWSNDYDIAKNVWDDPLGAGETALNETFQPLADSYEKGGLDEALGRSPSVLAGIIGGKGINKLDNLEGDKPGDGDNDGDGDDGDGDGGTNPDSGADADGDGDRSDPDASPSPQDVLQPDGEPIGKPGSRPQIRELPGGDAAAEDTFKKLAEGGRDVTPAGHPGKLVELPDGSRIGLRLESRSGPPTVDVKIQGVDIKKLKFLP